MGVRADLAAAIRQAIADDGISGVTVYPAPVDVVDLPAVVLEGDDPYIEPTGFSSSTGGNRYQWRFAVHMMTQRAEPASAYDTIETLRAAIETAVRTFGQSIPGAMTAPRPATMNDIPTIEAAITVSTLTSERI